MTRATPIPATVTLHVPFRLVKRGGRKEMRIPDRVAPEHKVDNTLVKALARAFRWKRMLESGNFATIADLAKGEAIPAPYLTRTLRLTQLAPDLVESILDGSHLPGLKLEALRNTLPMAWSEQRTALSSAA